MLLRACRELKPKDEDNFGMGASGSLVEVWYQLRGGVAAAAAGRLPEETTTEAPAFAR